MTTPPPPSMSLARIACKYFDIDVTATLPNGNPATLAGIDVAVVRAGDSPDSDTTWAPAQYNAGVATVMLAGPEATNPPPAAVAVNEPGGDVWGRTVDNPETDAAPLVRIVLV